MTSDPTFGTTAAAGSAGNAAELNVNTAVVTPTDRVRWPAIIAGLFAALSTLAVLSILGIAIGLSAYDPGDNARRFGMGAGIWGFISMIAAFFFGGWLAARSAAVRGERNGLLNGALVWAVAIPLMAWVLAGGAMRMTDTAANVAGPDSRQRVDEQVDRVVKASAGNRADTVQVSNEDKEKAAKASRRIAWGTLASMLLGLIAAGLGGWTGARERGVRHDHEHRRDEGGARVHQPNR